VADTVVARFEATARRQPERVALRWDGGALTYRQLDQRAGGFARTLHHGGVRAGDRVALVIGNRSPFVVALLGALKLGATVAPLDPRLTDDERATIVEDLAPAVVVHDVVTEECDWPSSSSEAPAVILYTSGSTGAPKGAVLSQRAVAAGVASWIDPVMALTADDVVLAVLPLSHSYGLNGALLAPLVVGATVGLVDRFSPEAVLGSIRGLGVSVFPGVATMFRRLLDADAALGDLRRLRIALSGAAPCPWSLASEWREATGVRILRGYGMTELFRPISYVAADPEDRPDAIGRPVAGVEVKIVGEDGAALPAGERGELFIRSPAAMDQYLGAPDETRAVLSDGWFRTGDLATIGPGGFVRIDGRKRERILRGGYSIFPQEVEAVLMTHPAVTEAAVIGVGHPELGEEVTAFVALRQGADVSPEVLVAWCRERLASFKYPRHVTILDALPKASTGKVLKAALRNSG
jgi:long-chain acyl-CoA synthetase